MDVILSIPHFVYMAGILAVIGFMVFKKDTTVVCVLGIFALGLATTSSLGTAVCGVFNSFIVAINELSGTILIISIISALCAILDVTGINEKMISPVTKLIKSPLSAYWVIGLVMLAVSIFFWPSPAVALIGAVFLPVALKAKLPAMGVAVAINLFGHGIALSGDFVIQAAPKLAADGAGIDVSEVVAASIPLAVVMAVVTTVTAYIFLIRDIKKGRIEVYEPAVLSAVKDENMRLSPELISFFALLIPVFFGADILIMMTTGLTGGEATALVGGTALFLTIIIAISAYKDRALSLITENIAEGFSFSIKIFAPVIPIAAFFYLGDSSLAKVFGEAALPQGSAGLVNDLGLAFSTVMPVNKAASAAASTVVGVITGLDGSGFSGINLAGSVAKIFSVALGYGTATLASLGQLSGIWVGGGTVIPWAVVPVAAICNVSPVELAARNLKPVMIGLAVTTFVAVLII